MSTSKGTLETRTLGRSGLDLTAIGMGLWAQGAGWGPVDDRASLEAIDVALEEGVTFFDTADVYGHGHSEELLGRAMKGRRDRFIVASKIGWIGYDGERNRSAYDTVDKLVAGVESSLDRLGTDHLEVIQCHVHYPEPNTPVFIEGFRRLKEQGKVRAWGVSTSDLAHLETFAADGDCDVLQVDYSILNRTPELDILPYCREHGIGVIVRGPLAMGILTGKLHAQWRFAEGDFRRNWVDDPAQHEVFLRDLDMAARLGPVAGDRQTLAQLALRFTISHPAVTTVIPGARNARQARENIGAGRLGVLDAREQHAIDELVPPTGGRKIWPA